jgi:hypothetical protein
MESPDVEALHGMMKDMHGALEECLGGFLGIHLLKDIYYLRTQLTSARTILAHSSARHRRFSARRCSSAVFRGKLQLRPQVLKLLGRSHSSQGVVNTGGCPTITGRIRLFERAPSPTLRSCIT